MGQAGRLAATLYLQGLCIFSGDTEGVSSLWHSRGLVVRFGPESPPMPRCKPLPAGWTQGTPRLGLSHRALRADSGHSHMAPLKGQPRLPHAQLPHGRSGAVPTRVSHQAGSRADLV